MALRQTVLAQDIWGTLESQLSPVVPVRNIYATEQWIYVYNGGTGSVYLYVVSTVLVCLFAHFCLLVQSLRLSDERVIVWVWGWSRRGGGALAAQDRMEAYVELAWVGVKPYVRDSASGGLPRVLSEK